MKKIAILLDCIKAAPQSKRECFLKFAVLNELNALVKQTEYKSLVKYCQIKPKVYEQIKMVLENGHKEYFDSIYYDQEHQCVFIVIYGLQFCFHRTVFDGLNQECKDYITKIPQIWEGLRLQQKSEDILLKAIEIQHKNIFDQDVDRIILELKKNIPHA